MQLSRRSFLKGMGAGAAGAVLGARLGYEVMPVVAQSVPTGAAFYRTTLGEFEVTVIRDGVASTGLDTLAANADVAEVNALLAANGFPQGQQPNNFKQLLVNTGDNLVLFDTGRGAPDSQLIPTLELIGVAPQDITEVVITHWHGDHIGGVAPGGSLAFPNARHLIAQAEWNLLNSDTGNQGFQNALNTFQPVLDSDLLEYYNDGDEVLPGITAVAAAGHTPGHHGFLITSGDSSLLNSVDAIIHPVISVQRPDWYFGFDADPDQAVSTRRALLDQAASDDLMLFGYHFPFPGLGYIAADMDNGWRFTAASY